MAAKNQDMEVIFFKIVAEFHARFKLKIIE